MQTPRCREGAGSLLSATGAADSPERRRLNPAADRTADGAAFKTRSIEKPLMADSTSAVAIPPVSPADLERAEAFAREPFLLEGEDPGLALANGPRRRALDAALAEIGQGRDFPSIEWRRRFSLLLGLE